MISASVSWLILRGDRLRAALLAEIRQQKERSRQPLFARIEELVDQVRLHADGSLDEMRDERLGELRLCGGRAAWSASSAGRRGCR